MPGENVWWVTSPELAAQVVQAGERPEVAQLVRVDDGANRLYPPVGDVQHEHVDQAAGRVKEHRPGLPVDLGRPDHDADLADLVDQATQEPAHVVAPGDRARPGRPGAAAVPVHHGVFGEQADQAVDFAAADGGKEPGSQFLAPDPGG